MDRGKMSAGNSKKKIPQGAEFFVLGKGGRDDKAKIATTTKSSSSLDRKREATSTISNISKKPKLVSLRTTGGDIGNVASGSGAASGSGGSGATVHELWEQMATESEPLELIVTINAAIDQHDNETVIRLLCGAIKQLTAVNVRLKPDSVIFLVLPYIAKMHPEYFCNDIVTSALLSLLRRESNLKTRQNSNSHVMATNLLARGYSSKAQWPDSFLRAYIEDAINERNWVDNELCAPFVESLCAAFQTKIPAQALLQLETGGVSTPTTSAGGAAGTSNTHLLVNFDDDSGDNSIHGGLETGSSAGGSDLAVGTSSSGSACVLPNRYAENEAIVERLVVDAIKEQLNKRQQQDSYTRNLLKFLCTTTGLYEVRHLCIARLELWIHSGKLVKFAQQLLAYICCNVKCKDHEVLGVLVKMRLKTKPLINFYMSCLKETINQQPDILAIVLKFVVQNELSNTRNPNNMGMLATMFQTAAEQSAVYLAEIYKEFLLQRDDCLRTLRVFLRELVRMLRFDLNVLKFCKVFLSDTPSSKQIEQSDFKERIFHSMVDITCLCMLLSVSPQVREANMCLRTNRDAKSNPVLIKFYAQMSQLQLDAVTWMYETVPTLFKLTSADYNQALHKLLLLENPDQYSRYDQWPSEPERATLLRLASETPIHEDTLLRIIMIGITKDIPLNIPDSIEIIMLVTKRASTMRFANCPAVQANKLDIIDFLFSMAEYHHPENIKLPVNYEPPKLAIIVLYWKAWLILLMISAHNPSTFGAFCWEHYPTMKMLMEMCITNQFNENGAKDELQIVPIERDHILEFESYLAAQTSQAIITEENAILISQLMLMDPMGPARRVPAVVIDQLRYLNKTLKLGHLLCRSRKPDLLLDIIQRQGTTQSMPWLSDLVQNSEGDFNHLPVQCLCEFLLFNAAIINEDNSRDAELVNFLRQLILEPNASKQTVCEVLDYIFRRLSSTVKQSRIAALGGLKIIFKCADYEENDWLLRALPRIPYFADVRAFIIPQLRAACQVENCPKLVMAYIQFIAAYTLNDPVTDMLDHVIDMAQLIVERSTMFQHIIPAPDVQLPNVEAELLHESRCQTLKCLFVMFNNYIIKLQEHHEPYEWTEYPDLLLVQFDDGVQLPLHLNIIHAFIILLTHSSHTIAESMPILDYWFPPGRPAPIGFVPNMPHEPVQLLPDWLKLKMIRSAVDRLIEAALHGLTPDQIVLFVQNFGTPINSMSKLLALLDHAVTDQIEEVKNAILNKAYLAQLIEIQQARGAKNGHFTVQALGLHSHSQTVPDLPKLCDHMLESLDYAQLQAAQPAPSKVADDSAAAVAAAKSGRETEEMVHSIVQTSAVSDVQFRRFVHQLMERCNGDGGGSGGNKTPSSRRSHKQAEQIALKAFAYLAQQLEQTQALNWPPNANTFTFLRALLSYQPSGDADQRFKAVVLQKFADQLQRAEYSMPLSQAVGYQRACLLSIVRGHQQRQYGQESAKADVHQLKAQYLTRMLAHSDSGADGGGGAESTAIPSHSQIDLSESGQLVDWVAEIDPELTIMPRHLQISYLFSKACGHYRFYLLSLICHQTNWQTLVDTLDHLLRQPNAQLDSTMVLNFIDALINNPKLWQGRDKCVSKSDKPEVVFCLRDHELDTFAHLLLSEGDAALQSTPESYDYHLCSRINLLLRLTNRNSSSLVRVVDYVCAHTGAGQPLRQKVLQQMYLMYPSIKFIRHGAGQSSSSAAVEYTFALQSLKGCEADKVSNYLITCLGNLVLKKDFESLSSDTELLLRKLAASHPALFLRQLGVLASLIQGRAQLSMRVLRDEHHCQRFIQILRTLEILQPLVFDDVYKCELQTALTCYFTFFRQHSYAKETYHILIKFVELLQSYINVNPSSALHFIEQYVDVLMELATKFTSLASLHQLIQGIALLQHKTTQTADQCGGSPDELKQDFDYEDQSTEGGSKSGGPAAAAASGNAVTDADVPDAAALVGTASGSTVAAAAATTTTTATAQLDINSRGAMSFAISSYHNRSSSVSPHFLNLIKLVKQSNTEDAILGPLQEIESLSSKRFSFLSELFDRLLELIFSPSAQIRSNAFILLIRHLKHNPGRTDLNRCTLNAYIQCLRDDNSSVAATAVDHLGEMTLLLQEHAVEILCVTFSLGIRSRLNTSVQIKRVLQTLMLQHGY